LLPNKKIINAASNALKSPFTDRGRTVLGGLDCWGLIKYIYDQCGMVDFPDFVIDCEDRNKIYFQFIEEIKNNFYPIQEKELIEGDIITMNMLISAPSIVHHFGVYIGNNKFIHTLKKQGPQITSLNDTTYRKRIRGFYRWIGNK
jgi:cell wall-associated NlpC family hydrolase